jgi:hypothetical protein
MQDQEWTTSYRLETAAKLKQVEDLTDPEHPRVFNVTRCSRCGGQLDLPSVHFMCNHSFHQPRCVLAYSVLTPLLIFPQVHTRKRDGVPELCARTRRHTRDTTE